MLALDLANRSVSRHLATRDEYMAAMAELQRLTDRMAPDGTPERDWVELLATLVSAYEEANDAPLALSSPQQVVDHLLEAKGLTRAALGECMGGRSRVSEFFAGKRPLSTSQVIALRDLLGAPADALIPKARPTTRARHVKERNAVVRKARSRKRA